MLPCHFTLPQQNWHNMLIAEAFYLHDCPQSTYTENDDLKVQRHHHCIFTTISCRIVSFAGAELIESQAMV